MMYFLLLIHILQAYAAFHKTFMHWGFYLALFREWQEADKMLSGICHSFICPSAAFRIYNFHFLGAFNNIIIYEKSSHTTQASIMAY